MKPGSSSTCRAQAALNTALPPGWTSNISAQGNAKDCNLRVSFIDRVDQWT